MSTQLLPVSDEELHAAFKNTNFGVKDHRSLLNTSVLKKLVGYHCGHTITCIMQKLGLIGKTGKPSATKTTQSYPRGTTMRRLATYFTDNCATEDHRAATHIRGMDCQRPIATLGRHAGVLGVVRERRALGAPRREP